jgi:hypothetical protein
VKNWFQAFAFSNLTSNATPGNAVAAKEEDGLGLEGEKAEEEDFDVVEKREKKKAMDKREAQRLR